MDSLDPETPGGGDPKTFSVEDAKDELALLLESGRVTAQEVSALQAMTREIVAGKDKVSKLKSLLGRSAKAQRETKVEFEHTLKRLKETENKVERLEQKVTTLNSRPTHMELLQDFETNFDRALVNVDRQASQKSLLQAGGQDTAPAPTPSPLLLMDNMLLQELTEAKSRIESLETLQKSLKQNSVTMETTTKSIQQENETLCHSIKTLQLELKMAQMETIHANRQLEHSNRSLQEMQMEIDLLTKNKMNSVKNQAITQTNSRQVQQLQSQVQALQEWALASAEAKSLAMEHVAMLEQRLHKHDDDNDDVDGSERVMWSKTNSLVIGAGDVGFVVLEESDGEHAVLRWKFDCAPQNVSVDFSVLQSVCDTPAKQSQANYLIKERYVFFFLCILCFVLFIYVFCSILHSHSYDTLCIYYRTVTGGAAGELEAAFAVENACTLVWSNTKSWVRPRTVTYTVEAVALSE
jgi:hypothetical protein